MAKKELTNNKVTLGGLLSSFIFGLLIGGFVYLIIKTFNLKSWVWYILFAFLPPFIGAVIYATSKTKVIK
ncbi:MAG: hypothetical protein ACRC1F_02085 [Metamycoplasmataceae bacterium]